MTEVVLYHNAMSTCSQKVRLALEEKALAWQSREIVRHQNIWHRLVCDLEEGWPHLMVVV